MIKASIISIGNELLSGMTVDSNAAYLSGELQTLSIQRVSGYVVSDDIKKIKTALQNALREADVVILTGGLGPTEDDITADAIADYYQCELLLNEEILNNIKCYFMARGREMPKANKKQAYIPKCAEPIFNTNGSAPGIKVERKGKLIYAIPGVPSEAKKMFEKSIKTDIEKLGRGEILSVRYLSCFGKSESEISQLLKGRMERGRNPLVNITVHQGVKTIQINAVADTQEQANEMNTKEQNEIADILGDIVYSYEKESLAEVVSNKLKSMNKTIATAESCTGGLIGKLLTDIAGSSQYYKGGIIAYSNDVKTGQLDVPCELLKEHGAVSQEVADFMAVAVRKKFDTDISVSTTGIAGPGGATADKKTGLVYIGLAWDNNVHVEKCNFKSDRQTVRNLTANTCFNLIRLKVLI